MAPLERKKKFISHKLKLEVIQRKKKGEGNSAIGRALELSESTVRTIWKNRENIEKIVKSYGASQFDGRSRASNPAIIIMERYLAEHINRKVKEQVPVNGRYIREQAKHFYHTACRRVNKVPDNFRASHGWLNKFMKRKELKHVKFTGERGSADEVAAQEYPAILRRIIEEGSYTRDQIYNVDETGLQYKLMPTSTYISKSQKQARGRKVEKARFTVMLTVNLSGSHKMKPVVVHTAANPRCYKNLRSMDDSGVYWYKTCNGWMTSNIMQDWLQKRCIPDAKTKCRELGTPFKMLLLLDNAPCHPRYLEDLHKDVKVVFLPPRTTSLVQPLDQEVIATLKNYYQTHLYDYLREKTETNEELHMMEVDSDLDLDEMEDEPTASTSTSQEPAPLSTSSPPEMTVTMFWKTFSVKNAVDFMLKAWDQINTATIHHSWRELVPHLCTPSNKGKVQTLTDAEAATLTAARQVPGFSEVTLEEIRDTQAAAEVQTPTDIIERIDQEDTEYENTMEPGQEPPNMTSAELPIGNVSKILAALDELKDQLNNHEQCRFRTQEVLASLDSAFRYYKERHSEEINRRQQTLITSFFSNPSTLSAEPVPSTSQVTTDDDDDDFEGFMSEVERGEDVVLVSDDEVDDAEAP